MSYPNQNSQGFNYKSNWNTSYTIVNAESGYWSSGGSVLQYVSSNPIVINDAVVTNNFGVSGNLTVQGNLTAQGITTYINTEVYVVTALSGNFTNLYVGSLTANELFNDKLQSVFSTVQSFSGIWDESEYLSPIQSASGTWNSVYTTSRINSAYWSEAYSNLAANSANYANNTNTDLISNSAKWNSNYTSVNQNSSKWEASYSSANSLSSVINSTYTSVSQNSASWNAAAGAVTQIVAGTNISISPAGGTGVVTISATGVVTSIGEIPVLSGNWNNTYNQFSSNSAAYINSGFLVGRYLPLSGGKVTGNLIVSGARVAIGTDNPDCDLFVVGTTYIEEIKEKVTLSSFNANSTINFDLRDQSLLFLTLSSSGNWTVNFRASPTTTLNSIMTAGQSFTCVTIVSTGTTVFYNSAVQIDGTTCTPFYLNGLIPQAVVSNSNSFQNYAYTIIKRGENVFTVLASVNEYY